MAKMAQCRSKIEFVDQKLSSPVNVEMRKVQHATII